jgi:alkyl-hydroperoxide reductase/thiol specific antioxidant family protein
MIGNGPPAALGPFTREMTLDGRRVTVVTDPSLTAFRAAGLARPRLHGWRAVIETLRAVGAGYRVGRPAGDIMQLGGAVLVDDAGRVVYHHRGRSPGDLADSSDIVQAALALLIERRAAGRRV